MPVTRLVFIYLFIGQNWLLLHTYIKQNYIKIKGYVRTNNQARHTQI